MIPVHLDDERAQRYLDGQLPGPEQAQAEAHVACCPACQAVVEGCCALAEALSNLPAAFPPAGFTGQVLCCIEERDRAAARERRAAAAILSVAGAAAAVLLLAAGASAWAPFLSRLGDGVGAAATWLRLGGDVAEPLLRALRLEIAAVCAAASLPLLYAMRRLSARAVPARVAR